MILTLRMTGGDGCPAEERALSTGTLTLGRGAANDWVLADPERVLSKHHCRFDQSEDGFLLTDLSTNGVVMEGERQPIGRGHSRALQDGDVAVLGAYQIAIGIHDPAATPARDVPFSGVTQDAHSPITREASEPWLEQIPGGDFGADRHVKAQGWEVPLDPANYAASGTRVDHPLDQGPLDFSQASEHVSAVATVMRLPAAQTVLPTNWMDGDPMAEVQLAPTPLDPVSRPPEPIPAYHGDLAPLAIPNEELLAPSSPSSPPSSPPSSAPIAPEPSAPPPSAARPIAVEASAPVASDGWEMWAAFLEGAGLTPDTLAGIAPADTAYDLGRMVRAAVDGMRDILATRALIKSELRVEQTSVRATDNNAMKFAPDVQRCLDAMIGLPPQGFMSGSAAMQQAMTDIKRHELALVAALNGVFTAMTEKLDPVAIADKVRGETNLAIVPYARKARCWDLFTERYQALQGTEAQNTGGSLLAPLADSYARQLRRTE